MRITTLTFVAFYLNAAIDSGRYDDLTLTDLKAAIDNGTVFDLLRKRLGQDIDLSILSPNDEAELLREWQDLASAVNERRKMGIERRGLTLLVAYLLEGIQQRLPR
jgi:hypothetical protein